MAAARRPSSTRGAQRSRPDALAGGSRSRRPCVLTPHPGEFERLDRRAGRRRTTTSAAACRGGRPALAARSSCSRAPGRSSRRPTARVARARSRTPALATAGTGDVLAGTIGSLLAQGVGPFEAACLGVYLHGTAAEHVRERLGDAGLLASDLLAELPRSGVTSPSSVSVGATPASSGSCHAPLPRGAIERDRRAAASGGPARLPRPVWLEIDLDALAANVRTVRGARRAGNPARRRGQGRRLRPRPGGRAPAFLQGGADRLCVATLDEALALRAAGIARAVAQPLPGAVDAAQEAARAGHRVGDRIGRLADRAGGRVVRRRSTSRAGAELHLEVETGLGVRACRSERCPRVAGRSARHAGLELASLWTHLAEPDDREFAHAQHERLEGAAASLRAAGLAVPPLHLAATGGLFAGTAPTYAMVRAGLALYGELPTSCRSGPTPGRPPQRCARP